MGVIDKTGDTHVDGFVALKFIFEDVVLDRQVLLTSILSKPNLREAAMPKRLHSSASGFFSLILFAIFLWFLAAPRLVAQSANQYALLRKPTASKTQIAFSYGGDLWIVDRNGGEAKRLTSDIGIETNPFFSPDGSLIAFTGEYDGNEDVYVMSVTGGIPKRLTTHPGSDQVVGWTRDGKRILFRSSRNSWSRFNRLFAVSIDGGLPEELPLPMAEE